MGDHPTQMQLAEATEELARSCADALESAPVDSVIAGLTAAHLHRLWLPNTPDASEPIHVATATPGMPSKQMTRTRRAGFVAHRYQLRAAEVTEVFGLPVVSLERCWVELSGSLGLPDLVAAGDSALRAGATTDGMQALLDRMLRPPGTRRAREALTLLDRRSRSRPESHLRVAVHGVSRVPFEVNEAVFRDEGGWLAQPDLSLVAAKLALEYQGEEHATVQRMRRDLSRGLDLRGNGWRVIEYGPAAVLGRPWLVRSDVRIAIGERAPDLLRRRRARMSGRERTRVGTIR